MKVIAFQANSFIVFGYKSWPIVMAIIAFQAKGKEVENENYKLLITNY
jgi:hypothetical protein